MFLTARAAGNEDAAREAWGALVDANYPRVKMLVKLESHGRLSPDEQDDAAQLAALRLFTQMIATFKGTSMGEWVNATKTLVKFACIDTQRRAEVHSRRRASLDGDDHDGLSPSVNGVLLDHAALAEADEDAASIYDIGADFLGWALPQISEKRREVIECDLEELSCEQIQQKLNITRDAVYANRSRALKDLIALRKEYVPA